MGHKFSLVLSREITEDESAALKEAGCTEATFGADSHPTNPDLIVTKMEFDDASSPSLAEAIESALEAVKVVPDLSVPGLTVPAQPVGDAPGDLREAVTAEVTVVDEVSVDEASVDEASPAPLAEVAAHG